ncbi:hypothetical protein Mp_3g08900 [Marchantia polymorpha subsp. ruderalis]|uniref:Uncharacterized protein n=2 Tax=Marchantia polymorpha TaxID=3197 RepID=A0AAF6AYU9_MARPO|nr:hypothetical protein MARPO_0105s0027 [Marchantia polymorpha]BBN04933.1 hypothetical protein Mp_3g08900 [Marchantia polymorpha subsp. ruderalis]|eukprot:PTQ31911.1 hypothetical protein MARPO_0105s0027 [Marchantia polymorpha]
MSSCRHSHNGSKLKNQGRCFCARQQRGPFRPAKPVVPQSFRRVKKTRKGSRDKDRETNVEQRRVEGGKRGKAEGGNRKPMNEDKKSVFGGSDWARVEL